MKFNGIVASLAIASTASAAAIPRDVAVQQALDQVTTVAGNVDNLVNGLVGGLLGCSDVTKVQQGMLQLPSDNFLTTGHLNRLTRFDINRAFQRQDPALQGSPRQA
ncbi:hypothetical protein ASPWEDRAFT_37131 [Aspergillus wentii DTO 134E9]|uniref:Uncharacterized protein n=1 Tax=Aspergillus wentii DTO 134E9 TaxID=1073089 RepID=A0A1L9RWX0_ASPWE|nr:uncharacterized protein ASPWEDRAFT_37131 [Aspergillus wentii DTO 134E9]OJJ39357.1 hypothetical protein ASPWEDRAFT_37131 [Aspergillus wentii DTO 134E9]